ncbi:hypothetical protein E8E13_009682 [Curvularia kusanoi]|uniref:Transcription initiation factor IIF subunit alpha n=1 Tax=Curvularia kusanoi TaxID=90978 RepID=A0A9P4WBX8_CURKU|nr:hypothetical protein E8E13_009682 [Curvularia kusanoi]
MNNLPSGPPQQAPPPARPNGQPPIKKKRPRPKEGPLRAPRRPLAKITKPLTTLAQMNQTNKPAEVVLQGVATQAALRNEYQQAGATSFPLVVTRRDLKDLRHHVMRLQNKTLVDVQDPNQFATPIRLHRRDPRAPPSGAGSHFEEEDTKEDLEELQERERIEKQREERRKIREENQAKIAPTGKSKPQAFQKKTEQKYRPDDTPEAKKRQLLRYEETLPWHLEDFENKQTWVGTYESELSETHVMLSQNSQGSIQMAPIERWYRFNVKGKVKVTGDDTDKVMFKVERVPNFLRNIEARAKERAEEEALYESWNMLSKRVGGGADDEGRIQPVKVEGDIYVKREADADDIDFNLEEDFADDEEGLNGLFEGDEVEVKEASEKLKRDQLAASLWDRNEKRIQEEEERAEMEAEMTRELEKSIRKTLVKKGKLHEYADSDMSDVSDTDSETERQRAKEEEEKKAAEAKATENGNAPSGVSSKGTNTPLGSSTPSGAHKPVDKLKSKKRPNSEMSEASGNESSRISKKKKKNKLNVVLGRGSPTASATPSRAGSPVPGSPASSQPQLPTVKDIYEALPPEGMSIQSLINIFKSRVGKTQSKDFISIVKLVSSFDNQRKWLTPLPQLPSQESIDEKLKKKQ